MAIEGGAIAKDFHLLLKNVNGMSGGQVTVTDWEDDLSSITVTVAPSDGLYKGGQFIFKIIPPKGDKLDVPPRVYCKTMIYHPNIDTLEDDGEICLNLLEDDMWTPHMGLQDVVQGILFLFYNPNLEDPLTCVFAPDMSQEEYEANVKLSLEGGLVEGYQFPEQRVRSGDELSRKGVAVTEEVGSGAIEIHVEVDVKVGDGKDFDEGVVEKEDDLVNRVVTECNKENEIISRVDPECNIIEEDEGTPVDGYPQVPTTGDAKVKNGIHNSNTLVRYESASPNTVSFQRGAGGKIVPGRLNFWWGLAIRRVRRWNVFS